MGTRVPSLDAYHTWLSSSRSLSTGAATRAHTDCAPPATS